MPPGLASAPAFLPAVTALHLLLAGLLAAVAWRRPAERCAAGVAATAAICWMTLTLAVLGPRLPIAWLSPVREGWTEAHLDAVAAIGLHAGPLLRGAWFPWLLPHPTSLRDAAALNLALTGAALAVLAAALRQAWGWRALVPLAAVGASPATWSTAFGETSAAAIWMYAALALQPFAALRDPRTSRGDAAAAAGALVVLTGIATLARVEVAALGVAALVGGAAARCEAGRRLDTRVASALDAVGRHPWRLSAFLGAWVLTAEVLLPLERADMRTFGQATWALYAASPLGVRALGLPVALAAVLPIGVVVLATAGAGMALRAPLRHAGLPLVLLWLFGTWWLAAHGGLHGQQRPVSGWELYRYTLLAVPWVVVLAALGLKALPRRALPFALAACLLPAAPPALALLRPAWAEHPGSRPPWAGPLDQDAQRETRALLARVEAHPTCAVLSRGQPWARPVAASSFRWGALAPWRGGMVVRHADLPADTPPREVLAALGLDDVPCAVAWHGLDCSLRDARGEDVGSAGCGPLADWEPLDVAEAPHRPFVHPAHGGRYDESVTSGLRRVPGLPPEAH